MTLLIVVTQSYLIIQNMFEGLIWFIVPVSMIVINDVMAYIFGFFFGKTPLIKLSPKKTWEGFIGGGISTVLLGFVVSIDVSMLHMVVITTISSLGISCLVSISIFRVSHRELRPSGWHHPLYTTTALSAD